VDDKKDKPTRYRNRTQRTARPDNNQNPRKKPGSGSKEKEFIRAYSTTPQEDTGIPRQTNKTGGRGKKLRQKKQGRSGAWRRGRGMKKTTRGTNKT